MVSPPRHLSPLRSIRRARTPRVPRVLTGKILDLRVLVITPGVGTRSPSQSFAHVDMTDSRQGRNVRQLRH
jgi:hypothetical protein